MKCNICDNPLSEPKFNEDIGNYDPCDTCMTVIEDTLASYDDTYLERPAAAEEELGGPDPLVADLYPQAYSPFDDFA
jgi:hypothetical protein